MASLEELAKKLNAKLCAEGDIEISSIATSPENASADQLAFVFPDHEKKALKMINASKTKNLVLASKLEDSEKIQEVIAEKKLNLIYCKRPRFSLSIIAKIFCPARSRSKTGIARSAVVEESAVIDVEAAIGELCFVGENSKIGANTVLMPRVYIGANVEIGEGCLLHPGVVIEDYCKIGNRVEIQANAVIGSDGFSYSTEEASNLDKLKSGDYSFNLDRQVQHKIISSGAVIIEDDVEIGANTCVDRGTLADTKIGTGTKIDNLCQIAHNVQIGKDALIIAQAGIAGSADIGDRATLAGSCGVADNVSIGNDAVLGAFAGAHSDINAFMPMLGIPAIPYGEFMNRQRALIRLPKMKTEINEIKAELAQLKKDQKQELES